VDTAEGKCPPEIPDADDADDKPDDHGHSTNRPAYRRRHVIFFVLRMISQWTAALFYLAVSPVLRFAVKACLTPAACFAGSHSTLPMQL